MNAVGQKQMKPLGAFSFVFMSTVNHEIVGLIDYPDMGMVKHAWMLFTTISLCMHSSFN